MIIQLSGKWKNQYMNKTNHIILILVLFFFLIFAVYPLRTFADGNDIGANSPPPSNEPSNEPSDDNDGTTNFLDVPADQTDQNVGYEIIQYPDDTTDDDDLPGIPSGGDDDDDLPGIPSGGDDESSGGEDSEPVDPCAGVSCGSCQYCSGGNCYNINCGSCRYCSGGNCYNYCSGTDTSCGCTSCTNCNNKDGWYNSGSTYACCDLTDPDTACTCQDQEYRNYYCGGISCTYSVTNTQTLRSGCSDCGYCKTCSGGACIDKPGVKGKVTNVSLEFIKGAEIKILGLDKSITTDANGNYFICEFPQGTYDLAVSKKGFNPDTKQFTFDGTTININFTLYTAGSDCRPDCSKTNDEKPVCHMDCEGINGCHFYDDTLMNICTRKGEMIGVPVGSTVSYNDTHKATCCEGTPYFHKKTLGTSLVFPESENIIRITRIVFFRGQFSRMIIDVFK